MELFDRTGHRKYVAMLKDHRAPANKEHDARKAAREALKKQGHTAMLAEMPPDYDGLSPDPDLESANGQIAFLTQAISQRLDSLENRQKEVEVSAAASAASAAAEAAEAAAAAEQERVDSRVREAYHDFLSWIEPDESKAADTKALWEALVRGEPPPKH